MIPKCIQKKTKTVATNSGILVEIDVCDKLKALEKGILTNV